MRFKRLSPTDTDLTFWQLLCVASPRDFLTHGERLLSSLDILSPGVRVDIALHRDGENAPMDEAARLLAQLASRSHGTVVYRLWPRGNARGEVQRARRLRWNVAAAALRATYRPILLVSPRTLIEGDLAMVPAELRQADVSFGPTADVAWLWPGERTQAFVAEVRRLLRGSRRRERTEMDAVAIAYRRSSAFLRFIPLPTHYGATDPDPTPDPDTGPTAPPALRIGSTVAGATTATGATASNPTRDAPAELIIVAPRTDVAPTEELHHRDDLTARMSRLAQPETVFWRHGPAELSQ